MAFPSKGKPDFLDSVVSEAGPGKDDYGAKMESDPNEGDPEEEKQDQALAAKSIMKAVTSGDAMALADALRAFVSSCSDGGSME